MTGWAKRCRPSGAAAPSVFLPAAVPHRRRQAPAQPSGGVFRLPPQFRGCSAVSMRPEKERRKKEKDKGRFNENDYKEVYMGKDIPYDLIQNITSDERKSDEIDQDER